MKEHLINLGLLIEGLNLDHWKCLACAVVKPEGIQIEIASSATGRYIKKVVMWAYIETARFDILSDTFFEMLQELGKDGTQKQG